MNVKIVRLTTGEDIICELNEDADDFIEIINGVQILPVPSRTGNQPNFMFSPFPLTSKDKSVKIERRFVVYIAEPLDEFNSQYDSMYGSGIVKPSQGIIV